MLDRRKGLNMVMGDPVDEEYDAGFGSTFIAQHLSPPQIRINHFKCGANRHSGCCRRKRHTTASALDGGRPVAAVLGVADIPGNIRAAAGSVVQRAHHLAAAHVASIDSLADQLIAQSIPIARRRFGFGLGIGQTPAIGIEPGIPI